MRMHLYATVMAGALTQQTALADIVVNFVESAPKDRFVINNTGDCDFNELTVEIDLSNSAGRLIFDTTATGAGVEVFQPFEVRTGNVELLRKKQVDDGEQVLFVGIKTLASGSSASFTIDVDDTLPKSTLGNIRVSGAEIANGLVNIAYSNQPVSTAMFNAESVAVIPAPKCETE